MPVITESGSRTLCFPETRFELRINRQECDIEIANLVLGHDDLEQIKVLTLPLYDAIAAVARGEIARLSECSGSRARRRRALRR